MRSIARVAYVAATRKITDSPARSLNLITPDAFRYAGLCLEGVRRAERRTISEALVRGRFGFLACDVIKVMEPSAQDVQLRRLLEGNRFRVQSRSWVPIKAHVAGTTVSIDFETPSCRRIQVELPDSFDVHEPEHVAWLFFNVERALAN